MYKKYDIAISFAGEDRSIALGIASILTSKGVSVFYDEFEKADLWGKDLYEHLISVYKDNSKYCLMLLSDSYSKKIWTSHERKAAQARAFKENKEYILPLKMDDTEVPGILETTGYLDYRSETDMSVVNLILKKLWGDLENDKGLNVLKIQLEDLYMSTMLLCDLSFMPSDHPNKSQHVHVEKIYQHTIEMFTKLKDDIKINAPTIDPLILRQITDILDGFENIINRAKFLLNINNPICIDRYFIGEIPIHDFHKIYNFLDRLNIFQGYAVKHKKHYKPEEIISNWVKAETETPRYCSDPKLFKQKKGLTPFVFDVNTGRKLNMSSINDGDHIRVFMD